MSNLPGSPAAKHLAVDLVTATQHIIISGLQEITDLRSCRPDQLDYLIEVLIHCYDLMKHLNDFSYMSLGRRHGEWKVRDDYSGHVAASRYEVLTSTPGITPQFASQILDAISTYRDSYLQSGENALDKIFAELQSQILPQLKTIKEFWVKALRHAIARGIPLVRGMPPISSAVLYEIDDIVTAIEHIVISTLEDLGKR